MIKKRNLLGQVGLIIITLGIYAIYWFYKISEEMKYVGKDDNASPELWIALLFIPFGAFFGMMFGEKTAPNHGMLFIFEYKGQQCFWMRNTPLPLSIAFIDDDGTILQINDMAPKTATLHCSQRPVRYALEMEQGWFAKKGAVIGSKIGGLPALN